jgi:hypothetical protein
MVNASEVGISEGLEIGMVGGEVSSFPLAISLGYSSSCSLSLLVHHLLEQGVGLRVGIDIPIAFCIDCQTM